MTHPAILLGGSAMDKASIFLLAEVAVFGVVYGLLFWQSHRSSERWKRENKQRDEERQTQERLREKLRKEEEEARERKREQERSAWSIREDDTVPWQVYARLRADTHPSEQQAVMLFLTDGRKMPGTYLQSGPGWRRADASEQAEVLCWRPVRYL